jgi:hypothetical protein
VVLVLRVPRPNSLRCLSLLPFFSHLSQAPRAIVCALRLVGLLLRDIDVHPEVAELLREFVGNQKQGLLFCSKSGKPLSQNNIRNRTLYPILESMGIENGGNHIFRRFRTAYLRKQRAPEDLIRLWLGHGNKTVTDFYAEGLENEKIWRKAEAERLGVGFTLPHSVARKSSVVPNVRNPAANGN